MKIDIEFPTKINIGLQELNNLLLEASKALKVKNLSIEMLVRYPKRFDKFIDKINKGEPFETIDGNSVILDSEKLIPILNKLKKSGPTNSFQFLYAFGFTTNAGKNSSHIRLPIKDSENFISLSKLKKTTEFGAEETGKRLAKEMKAQGQLDEVLKLALQENNMQPISIAFVDISGDILKTFNNIQKVTNAKGYVTNPEETDGVDKKADFILESTSGENLFISHKDGTLPKHFGQWGGISNKAGANITKHPEVIQFGQDLKASSFVTPQGFVRTKTIGREIKDLKLKAMGIFGEDYSEDGVGSPTNVDLVAQGIFKLEKIKDGLYKLSASHMITRHGFKGDFADGYMPCLMARYAAGRASFGIKDCRAVIYPKNGRSVNTWI